MRRERFVTSFDGTELFVEESGEGGVPIVLSDGIGCAGFIWKHLRAALEPRHRVIHWNYRGHGRSQPPKDPEALSMEALRQDLLAVVTALELPPAVFFGHSMGTQVVLDFAVEHPTRVAGLVPVCGSYGRVLDTFHDNGLAAAVFPGLRELALRYSGVVQNVWSRVLASQVSYLFARAAGEVNGTLVKRKDFWPYFEHMASMDVRVFVRLLDSAAAHSVEERLSELRMPTLVIAGERDTFTPLWLSQRMRDLIPNAELLVVPGGTHVAPIEIPELVNLRVEQFIDKHLAAGATAQPVAAPARRAKAERASRSRKRRA